MSGIRLTEVDEATIPTPPAGKATIFVDDTSHEPSFKDDAGAVHSMVGAEGPPGDAGAPGDPGEGVPVGGTTGQVLKKASGTDFDTEWDDETGGVSTGTFNDHSGRHEDGGADEISLAGLAGESVTPQPPKAHASSHQSGGGDAIKLDDLAAPDDNTDLDASTSAHGLLKKLPGGTSTFLRADGAFAAPPGGAIGSAVVTGGTESDDGTYQYNVFTADDILEVLTPGLADILAVGAGGGGGGYTSGGGGAAGDVRWVPNYYIAGDALVSIGAGGAAGPATGPGIPGQGGVTSLGAIVALGGGRGGYTNASDVAQPGGDGASGGGGGLRTVAPGGQPVLGTGNRGGSSRTGNTGGTGAGGGGGGAGGVGADGTTGNVGGAGGSGVSITELPGFGPFAAGGGGGGVTTGGAGGSSGVGGHGGGTSSNTGITSPAANSGSGGGGGGNTTSTGAVGTAGAAGVVIVRTLLP